MPTAVPHCHGAFCCSPPFAMVVVTADTADCGCGCHPSVTPFDTGTGGAVGCGGAVDEAATEGVVVGGANLAVRSFRSWNAVSRLTVNVAPGLPGAIEICIASSMWKTTGWSGGPPLVGGGAVGGGGTNDADVACPAVFAICHMKVLTLRSCLSDIR